MGTGVTASQTGRSCATHQQQHHIPRNLVGSIGRATTQRKAVSGCGSGRTGSVAHEEQLGGSKNGPNTEPQQTSKCSQREREREIGGERARSARAHTHRPSLHYLDQNDSNYLEPDQEPQQKSKSFLLVQTTCQLTPATFRVFFSRQHSQARQRALVKKYVVTKDMYSSKLTQANFFVSIQGSSMTAPMKSPSKRVSGRTSRDRYRSEADARRFFSRLQPSLRKII
jgi:hypothetical protein